MTNTDPVIRLLNHVFDDEANHGGLLSRDTLRAASELMLALNAVRDPYEGVVLRGAVEIEGTRQSD